MKILKCICLFILSLSSNNTYSQFFDNNWITGFFNNGYNNSIVNFSNSLGQSFADSLNSTNLFFITNSSVSDSAGNLIFYTNGINLYDSTHSIMQNGTGLSPCYWTDDFDSIGLNIVQASLALPIPGNSNLFYLFHQSWDLFQSNVVNYHPKIFYYSVVDRTGNNGLGTVLSKNDTLISSDTLVSQGSTATKHANGRDWWLIHHKAKNNTFLKWLITPSGINGPFIQSIGLSPDYAPDRNIVLGSRFSPDGSKFAYIADGAINGKRIDYFDFDRCSGNFSNPQSFIINDSATFAAGISFSTNSRFLYISTDYFIYQYDTWASNIQLSRQTVATYDGHIFYIIPSEFNAMQLAPDGKIYISSFNFPDYFHIINYPDSAGIGCNIAQHSFNTLVRNESLPNNPNYRLGRLLGSPCDTLTNVSSIISFDPQITLTPNPNSGEFIIKYKLLEGFEGDLEIRDILGNIVYTQKLPIFSNVQNIELNNLSDGIYFCMLRSNNHSTALKFVKQ